MNKLKFNKNKKIISLISTINVEKLKKYTKSKNIFRAIPLPFIGMRKGPIIICPRDNQLQNFFRHLGKVIALKNEKKLQKLFGQLRRSWLLFIFC